MIPANQSFHSASLYVGDLHPEVTEALLFEIFNAVGPVASIRVCRDSVTRRSLGYAYVNFHQVADAERALDTMNYAPIKDRPCRIMWSQRDPTLRKSGVGNVFVKNLHPSIDNKHLYDTFSLFGNILSCKVATKEDGTSKGYGYVHYETAEAAEDAIEKINGMHIADQEVFVGKFQRRADRPGNAEWTNCFCKNLPLDWDTDRLQQEFAGCGEITSAVVQMAPATEAEEGKEAQPARSRGFGFVNFANHEGAVNAVENMNGRSFVDTAAEGAEKEIVVCRAQKRSERDRELRTVFEQLKQERMTKYQGVNLYVKNLDDNVDDDILRTEFAPHGTITSCRVMRDPQSQASRGFGFVCFSTPEEATKALGEMHNRPILSKPVYVALAQRKEARRAQLEAQYAQRTGGMGRGVPMGQPHMYGAAPLFYAQPNMPRAQQGFMYPPMVGGPRGGPRGMPYGARGPQGYQMPPYGMPMQGQQGMPGQGRGRGRGGRGQGGRGNQQQQQGGNPNGGGRYKLTANARNHPQREGMTPQQQQQMMMQQQQQQAAAAAQQQAMVAPQAPAAEPLTAASLAGASEEDRTNLIGERLYPLVAVQQPDMAGKITGMLLEIDTTELLELLESPAALANKISEAVTVLEAHNHAADVE